MSVGERVILEAAEGMAQTLEKRLVEVEPGGLDEVFVLSAIQTLSARAARV